MRGPGRDFAIFESWAISGMDGWEVGEREEGEGRGGNGVLGAAFNLQLGGGGREEVGKWESE